MWTERLDPRFGFSGVDDGDVTLSCRLELLLDVFSGGGRGEGFGVGDLAHLVFFNDPGKNPFVSEFSFEVGEFHSVGIMIQIRLRVKQRIDENLAGARD